MPETGIVPKLKSEDRRARQLVVTKRRASAILGAVTLVFLAVTLYGHTSGWAGYLQATAEASMVGGLADWFAVTALFRRPLGLPIPHTAIVAERKDQFGATLGEFVQESFLTPEVIVERVRAADVVTRTADWLADSTNAQRLAAQVADGAVAFADLLHDEEIRDAIEGILRDRVESVVLAPAAGRLLRYLTAGGRHDKVLDAALHGLDRYLDAHRVELHERLRHQAPWWLPGAVEDRLFERLLDGARAVLHEMAGDPQHQLRRDLDAAIAKLGDELETSPTWRTRGEQLKQELLAQPQLREWAGALWSELKSQLRTQAADSESELRHRLGAAIVDLGTRLDADAALRANVQRGLETAVSYVAEHFHGEIASLVSSTIARWDGAETSRRLELLLGPDLQYIRINGTVVGGLAGLVLYTISRLAS